MSSHSIVGDKIWCPLCNDHSKFIQVRNAAKLIDVNKRTIHRYIEEGKVYAVKVARTSYRVCTGCLMSHDAKSSEEPAHEKIVTKRDIRY